MSTHFSKLQLAFYMFKILIIVGKSPILLTLVPVNKRVAKVYMCNHHVCIIIIHSKANMNYLLPTCAHTAYQDIVDLSKLISIYKFKYIELLACIEQNLRHKDVIMLVAY